MSKILIVDDDAGIRELITRVLDGPAFDLLYADNGEVAFQQAVDQQPDVIIMDVMMPKMDGIAACRAIKDDPRTGGIPVLILTAKGEFDDRVRAEDANAEAYMTKPFAPPTLTKMVEHLLDVRAERMKG